MHTQYYIMQYVMITELAGRNFDKNLIITKFFTLAQDCLVSYIGMLSYITMTL